MKASIHYNFLEKEQLVISKLKLELESEKRKLEFESQKLEIQRKQFEIQVENEKVKIEIEKSRLWSGLLIGIIPLLAVTATIFYGIWTQGQTEQTAFELKAAEIMFNSVDAYELKLNGEILKQLFPEKLPKDFGSAFKPDSIGYDSYLVNTKKDLLKLISANPNKAKEIVANWRKVFPADDWVEVLMK